ncbi:hypothetical protein HJC99_04790 [Candidatus Saccharibacteria bacterium]|nr:hypothetical protein [Candidatus Saccharibacteria bacterium]
MTADTSSSGSTAGSSSREPEYLHHDAVVTVDDFNNLVRTYRRLGGLLNQLQVKVDGLAQSAATPSGETDADRIERSFEILKTSPEFLARVGAAGDYLDDSAYFDSGVYITRKFYLAADALKANPLFAGMSAHEREEIVAVALISNAIEDDTDRNKKKPARCEAVAAEILDTIAFKLLPEYLKAAIALGQK